MKRNKRKEKKKKKNQKGVAVMFSNKITKQKKAHIQTLHSCFIKIAEMIMDTLSSHTTISQIIQAHLKKNPTNKSLKDKKLKR